MNSSKYPQIVIGVALFVLACVFCLLMQKSEMEAQQLASVVDFYDFDNIETDDLFPPLDCGISAMTRKVDFVLQSELFTHVIEHRRDLGLNLVPTWERGPPPRHT